MEVKNNSSIYLQIADQFMENILKNKWVTGEKIPSIRDTAVEYEVNPNTTMRTYNYLQEKGIIFNKRGIGYYVAEDGNEKARELKKQQFIEQDLPSFFKTMKILGLSLDDLKIYYPEQ